MRENLKQIIEFLNANKVRATYGAVAGAIGVSARSVGEMLGARRQEVSWVVSASTGKPTGYSETQIHPDLLMNDTVIKHADVLVRSFAEVHQELSPRCGSLLGIDLAWAPEKNSSGIASGHLSNGRLEVYEIWDNALGLDVIRKIIDSLPNLQGISIDAPLIIKNQDGKRPCEGELSKVYSSRWAGCHPSNLDLFPAAPSVALSNYMVGKGYAHLGTPEKGAWQIECYPHPALVELFDLPVRLKYKKGSVDERRSGQVKLAALLLSLAGSDVLPLILPASLLNHFDSNYIRGLAGAALKRNEDALDAVVCLYIAGLYSIGSLGRIFGNRDSGYIYVPRSKSQN